ncbi:uncharacterized protein AMSG_12219 [Thecamonas trahens ATCC 50062]|uniref:Uncharacterized protein n=1 Tax=Thecamonas trahens ATCC 50062 TaxID=461836 RepID=A0A0L0DM77_THETB|nr:hypothetical protein AMSG_12219 [Thecamonas trahens ATCC 50062]KNC53429.1 hypothetical protein AMSG_12219 [Thecamonas trahens ATCC 50062]|eukprot:XP_013754495.1 hypothetical protein AMSG_12219 [Thecamonas trahens ATCC 50062]
MCWLRSAYEQTIADNNKLLDGDEVIEFLNSYFGGVPSYFAELFERVQDPSRHLDELVVPQGKYADLPRHSRRRNRETIPLVENGDYVDDDDGHAHGLANDNHDGQA